MTAALILFMRRLLCRDEPRRTTAERSALLSRRARSVARAAGGGHLPGRGPGRHALPDLRGRPGDTRTLRARQPVCALARIPAAAAERIARGLVHRRGSVRALLAAARRALAAAT